jgi:hypothetical protein
VTRFSDDDRQTLIVELTQAMPPDQPLQFIENMLPPGISNHISPGPREVIAAAVVRRAETLGRYETPPWLYVIAQRLEHLDTIASIKCRLSAEPAPRPLEPTDTHRFDLGMPFLDRVSLRDAIRQVLPKHGSPILVVRGERQTGKSYTAEFAAWLSAALDQDELHADLRFKVAVVPIHERNATMWTPLAVAERILSDMGRPLKPPDLLPPDGLGHIQKLCTWLLAEATPGERWWWVIDGACGENVPEDTESFVLALAERVSQGSVRERVRLVVLDWPTDALPGIPTAKVCVEKLSEPDAIGDIDVYEYLDRLLNEISNEVDPEHVKRLTERVLEDVPCGPDRLSALAESLDRHTRPMLERAGI